MSKMAILDPTCVLATGHNLDANRIFSERLSSLGIDVENHICKRAKAEDEDILKGFNLSLEHLYGFDGSNVDGDLQDVSDMSLEPFFQGQYQNLFFLNTDFYSINSIFNILKKRKETSGTRVFIRLIGVMENAGRDGVVSKKFLDVLKKNVDFFKSGCCVLMAEVEKYSSFLGRELGVEVLTVPYPARVNRCKKASKVDDSVIQLACLGQARGDKGYFQLLEVLQGVRERINDKEVVLSVQRMPQGFHEYRAEYESLLDRESGINSLKPRLSSIELEESVSASDILLLPYDIKTYEYRGSAMLFDGMAYGIPVITYRGVAFSKEVDEFKLGIVAEDCIDSYIEKVVSLIMAPDSVDPGRFENFQDVSIMKIKELSL